MNHHARSSRNTFSGLNLNRKPADIRDVLAWEENLCSTRSAFIPVLGDEFLFDPSSIQPLLLTPEDLGECPEIKNAAIHLGDDHEKRYFALNLKHLPVGVSERLLGLGRLEKLRRHTAALPSDTASLLGYAGAVVDWNHTTRFCSRCGRPTRPLFPGQAQQCTDPDCGAEYFPRVDPAVIVLVHHEDSCLLGRQATWKKNMYSSVAGYLEPGESVEDTVMRETLEETGIRVTDIRYRSSQPWPFSRSIMLGFHARAENTDIVLNDEELEDARWFAREEIPELIASGELVLPSKYAIARTLFDEWYENEKNDQR